MRRWAAAAGSAAYFAVAAGTFAVLVPWLVTGWELRRSWTWWMAAGMALIAAGTVPVVSVFVQFARAGGTPFPPAPTQHLVVRGFNRYVRNPVYVGSLLIFCGWPAGSAPSTRLTGARCRPGGPGCTRRPLDPDPRAGRARAGLG